MMQNGHIEIVTVHIAQTLQLPGRQSRNKVTKISLAIITSHKLLIRHNLITY